LKWRKKKENNEFHRGGEKKKTPVGIEGEKKNQFGGPEKTVLAVPGGRRGGRGGLQGKANHLRKREKKENKTWGLIIQEGEKKSNLPLRGGGEARPRGPDFIMKKTEMKGGKKGAFSGGKGNRPRKEEEKRAGSREKSKFKPGEKGRKTAPA